MVIFFTNDKLRLKVYGHLSMGSCSREVHTLEAQTSTSKSYNALAAGLVGYWYQSETVSPIYIAMESVGVSHTR